MFWPKKGKEQCGRNAKCGTSILYILFCAKYCSDYYQIKDDETVGAIIAICTGVSVGKPGAKRPL
jgi:hypothetical protein